MTIEIYIRTPGENERVDEVEVTCCSDQMFHLGYKIVGILAQNPGAQLIIKRPLNDQREVS